jgi:hypothetical protein
VFSRRESFLIKVNKTLFFEQQQNKTFRYFFSRLAPKKIYFFKFYFVPFSVYYIRVLGLEFFLVSLFIVVWCVSRTEIEEQKKYYYFNIVVRTGNFIVFTFH